MGRVEHVETWERPTQLSFKPIDVRDNTVQPDQAILLDLEGTLYTRDGVIAGAHAAIEALRDGGYALRFLTNSDSKTPTSILAGLHELQLDVRENELFTPVTAATRELDRSDSVILALTSAEVAEHLAATARIAQSRHDGVTHVVVGDVRDLLDYSLLNEAFGAIAAGARLVALQRGRYFLQNGEKQLDTGAIVAALEYAAEVDALVLGKPSGAFVQLAIDSLALPPDATVWVVGDDRSTDIAMAAETGLRSVLVQTGKFASQADDERLPRPDFTIPSIAQLADLVLDATE